MTQNGGRGAGGQDAEARRERLHRLHRFLCELVKREGRMEAAVLLGVNYRTLVKAEESGEMTGRMSDALERLLLTWDGGGEDGDGDGTDEPEPGGDLERRVEALEAGLEELAVELRSGLDAIRLAVAGDAVPGNPSPTRQKQVSAPVEKGGKDAPAQSPPVPPPVAGLGASRPARLRRVDPELVTREPAGDDPEVYGDAWPLVKEWRELKDRLPVQGRSLSWLTDYERLLTLELAMLEEHELTLPPQKQPVRDSLSRRDHTRWRWKALDRTQVAIRKRKLLRWLRRLLTLGAWWD